MSGWLQQAVTAAKNRRQQRFAHIIENAGTIVVGLRAIDREFHRLFLPLLYFDPLGWPKAKRQEWVERILALANEDMVLPRMRAADSALVVLASQETDREISNLIDELRHFAPDPFFEEGDHLPIEPIEKQGATSELIRVAIMSNISWADGELGYCMPEIVEALIGRDKEALQEVRWMAYGMVQRKYKYGLRAMADDAERNFGRLLAHQQYVFPALPSPTWVWES